MFDADELARQAVRPGTPGLAGVVARFGPEILRADGDLDRAALAARVFAEPRAREALEAIVHPEVFRLLLEGIQPHRDSDAIVIFDAPLIVEAGFQDACDMVVLVTAPREERIRRIVQGRGVAADEAGGRIDAQLPDEEKTRAANVVIANDGSLGDLEGEVDELWEDLARRGGEGRAPDYHRHR